MGGGDALSCRFGHGETGDRHIRYGLTHVIAPNGGRNRAACVSGVAARIIPDPDGRDDIRCVSDEPRVVFIIRRTGFACHGTADICAAARSVADGILENAVQLLDGFDFQHLAAGLRCLVIFEHRPVSVFDFQNGERFHQFPVVGKDAVCFCHIPDTDAVREAAEGSRQIRIGIISFRDERGNPARFGCFNHFSDPDVIGQIHRRDIERMDERIVECHRGALRAIVILRRPAGGKFFGRIGKRCRRRTPVCQRRHIGERLERRARLPRHLHGAIEMIIAAPADHGQNFARLGFHGEKRALRLQDAVSVLDAFRQIIAESCFRRFLHIQIERRVDVQAFLVDRFRAVFIGQKLNDIRNEIRGRTIRIRRIGLGQLQIRFLGRGRFRLRDIAVFRHLVEHDALAVFRRFQAAERRIIIRTVRQTGQHCALRQIQLLHIFSEIHIRRRLHAVATLAEINLVHVHLKNLVLRVFPFNLQRQNHFEHLAANRLLLCEKRISRELLGDRRAALPRRVAVEKIADGGAHDAARVNAAVIVETDVFGRDKGVLQILGHDGNIDRQTILLGVDRRDEPSFPIENLRGHIRRHRLRHIGHTAPRRKEAAAHGAAEYNGKNNEQNLKRSLPF